MQDFKSYDAVVNDFPLPTCISDWVVGEWSEDAITGHPRLNQGK